MLKDERRKSAKADETPVVAPICILKKLFYYRIYEIPNENMLPNYFSCFWSFSTILITHQMRKISTKMYMAQAVF
jgi:hypothetical protein